MASTAPAPGAGASFWVPEVPPGKYGIPLYRARNPEVLGKLGTIRWHVTGNIHGALQFRTREACEAWIRANPVPVFVAVEHAIMPAPAPAASGAATPGTRSKP